MLNMIQKGKYLSPGSTSSSLTPHKQEITGLIPVGCTKICSYGLYSFILNTFKQNASDVVMRKTTKAMKLTKLPTKTGIVSRVDKSK